MNGKEAVVAALVKALPDIDQTTIESNIERPKKATNGDYSFPAFSLAKKLHKSPVDIAKDVVAKIDDSDFEKVVTAGPFINFFLDKSKASSRLLQTIFKDPEHYGATDLGHKANVTIDLSSPNIAKPMGMGHLRSTVIGNSIGNIMEMENYNPIRINHLGDWGTQFGKLMAAYKMWGNEEEVRQDPINTLQKYYVRINTQEDEHPEYAEAGREWFKKLEDGDAEATRLWKWFRSESLKRFMIIYNLLGVHFDSMNGEAFYNDKMDEIVDLLREKNLLEKSRGAEIIDLSKYNLGPAMILKSDGSTLYMTRDLATALFRKREYGFKQSIYVVGADQDNYFRQLKAVLDKMGFTWSKQIHHVSFGLMTLHGSKMSTRRGNIVKLADVLNDSIDLARKQIAEKNPDLKNANEVAKQVGVGAVIFHDLKNYRVNSVDFRLEDVVKFEGETGPYVQYARARAESLLRKGGNPDFAGKDVPYAGDEAWPIITLLGQYQESVQRACENYDPSIIGKYALSLAKKFNQYYAHTRILEGPKDDQYARLAVVKAVSDVLKSALNLLGVQAPDEM